MRYLRKLNNLIDVFSGNMLKQNDIRTHVLDLFVVALFCQNLVEGYSTSSVNGTSNDEKPSTILATTPITIQTQPIVNTQYLFTPTAIIAKEPKVDELSSMNITTQVGTHAYLPCRVKQIGNKSVSWIRVRDGHILTVDRAVFIADQRFIAMKQQEKYWTLQIKYVQARDAGFYECQVSTEPKISSRVHLQVVVPHTEILGDTDRYVKAGSTVVLRCIVRGALEPPTFIMWYHGSEQLPAESRRFRSQIERNTPDYRGDGHYMAGSLVIDSVKRSDNGNYTCSPSNSPSVTVMLNIINGESSASAVKSAAPISNTYASSLMQLMFCAINFIVNREWHVFMKLVN